MVTFFGFIFLGLSLAAPIGPVNAAQLDRGIKSGFFHAWLVGIGSLLADVFYMVAIFFGVVHLLDIVIFKVFLWLFGCFVLTYTGIESIVNVQKIKLMTRDSNESALKSFFYGFLISISNPLSILFWLGIFGSVLAKMTTEYDQFHLFMYCSAIILGLFIWDVSMAGIASSFRRLLSEKTLTTISILSGISLIGFGIYFGYEAVQILFF